MKIISWNVNGIKSIIKGGFFDEILSKKPDILCFQEIKSTEIPMLKAILNLSILAGEIRISMELQSIRK